MKKPIIKFIELSGCSIYKQLQLEESLLRADSGNWCLLNFGTPDAIVLGSSSKPEEMIHLDQLQGQAIQIIQRFSGGGTVYVDQKTLFITFICHKEGALSLSYPEPILRWGENFYRNVFKQKNFRLQENDYALDDKKIGGNALYLRKDRWLLHTSFLWDYTIEKINLLKYPPKTPDYRKGRLHKNFLQKISTCYQNPQELISSFKDKLSQEFVIEKKFTSLPTEFLNKEHRKSLKLLSL